MHQISPFRARKGDAGFTPTQIPASKGDKGCRQPGHLIGRAWLRCPWAVAGLGRATNGRTTLQTSSNRSNLKPLARTAVTNVVNLRPKTTIFSEKAVGLTTFVTTDQKSTRKTPPIDDVCNNTQEIGQKSQRARPLRCPRAAPQWPGTTGVEGAGGTGGHGRASSQRAEPDNSDPAHWCGGHRRDRRAWLRCPWAVAGPGRASRRRAERSSRRGRLAGGPPPTGAPSSPAPQPGPTAPGTPAEQDAT